MERRERQFQEYERDRTSETLVIPGFLNRDRPSVSRKREKMCLCIQPLVESTVNHSKFDSGTPFSGACHGPSWKKTFLLNLLLSHFSILNQLTVKIAPTTEYAAQHLEPSPRSLHIVNCCCCCCCCRGKWNCRSFLEKKFCSFAMLIGRSAVLRQGAASQSDWRQCIFSLSIVIYLSMGVRDGILN